MLSYHRRGNLGWATLSMITLFYAAAAMSLITSCHFRPLTLVPTPPLCFLLAAPPTCPCGGRRRRHCQVELSRLCTLLLSARGQDLQSRVLQALKDLSHRQQVSGQDEVWKQSRAWTSCKPFT